MRGRERDGLVKRFRFYSWFTVSYDVQSRTVGKGAGEGEGGTWGKGCVTLSKSEPSLAQSGLYCPGLNVPCRCLVGMLCCVLCF